MAEIYVCCFASVTKTSQLVQLPPAQLTLWSVRRKGPSFICIPNLKRIALFIQKSLRVRKFQIWVTWPRPCQISGRFMVHTQGGTVLHLHTKFESDSLIRSKVIRGSQNFEIGSRDPGHAHLGVVLCCVHSKARKQTSKSWAFDGDDRKKLYGVHTP